MMEDELIEYSPVPYSIYIEIDEKNRVTKIFSDLFEQPVEKSIFIEAGEGDRFAHAHLYLEKTLYNGVSYNYKYVDGAILERTDEEKASDIVIVEPQPTPLELMEIRVQELEAELLTTNLYMTDVEIASMETEMKAQSLEQELLVTNQYLTDLELLVLENILPNI